MVYRTKGKSTRKNAITALLNYVHTHYFIVPLTKMIDAPTNIVFRHFVLVEADDDMLSSDDEEDSPPPTHIVTVDEMLSAGLCLRYKTNRLTSATRKTNMDRFNEIYNCYPMNYCKLQQ
jgi:hypothetical protein